MRRRDLLAGLSFVPLAAPAFAQCVVPTFRRINLPGRCEPDVAAPSLDLGFMTPGTLDPRITFTRASVGTYFDSAGVLQTAGTNAPRWDYDPVTLQLRGLLIEEARTNLMLQGANLAVAPWVPAGVVVAAPTVTANQVAAPDGTTTAARIVYPQVIGAGAVSYVRQPITTTAAVHACSMYLRGAVGGEQVYLLCADAIPTYYRALVTLTTSWQRFTLVTGTLTAASWNFGVGTDLRDGSQTTKPAQTIYAWGGQLEAGQFPTSYIPTTAATVTRAADMAAMTGTNFSSWFNQAEGTFSTETMHTQTLPANLGRLVEVTDGTTANGFLSIIDYSNARFQVAILTATATTAQVVFAGLPVASVPMKLTASYGPDTTLCVNTGTGPSQAWSNPPGNIPALSQVNFGNRPDGTRALNAYLRRVRYWRTALSDSDIRAVTA